MHRPTQLQCTCDSRDMPAVTTALPHFTAGATCALAHHPGRGRQAVQIYSQQCELDVLVKNLGWQLRDPVAMQITAMHMVHDYGNHGAHAHVHAYRVSNEPHQSARSRATSGRGSHACTDPPSCSTHATAETCKGRRPHRQKRQPRPPHCLTSRRAQHGRWRPAAADSAAKLQMHAHSLELDVLVKDLGRQRRDEVATQNTAECGT